MKEKFDVRGMTCSACSAAVEKEVGKVSGVSQVNVSLLTNSMTVEFSEESAEIRDNIIKAVSNAGYEAEDIKNVIKEDADRARHGSEIMADSIRKMQNRFVISLAFLIPLMYISMGHMFKLPLPAWIHGSGNEITFAMLQFLLTMPIVIVNGNYYKTGFKTLIKRHPNMDSLIAIGSGAAVVYGVYAIFKIGYGLGHQLPDLVMHYSMDLYFESAATILTLITLGKYLETRSKGKTSEAIARLIDLAPATATVIRDGQETEVPAEEVRPGDIVLVKPGKSIPVDGLIIQGETTVDMSALTGESMPVERVHGDPVSAATVNQSGFIKIEAVKVGKDTALARIIQLVEEAGASKAPISRLADRISGIFVPAVIMIALIAMGVWLILGQPFDFALSIAIAVLVISCPCALGLATPVAIMVGTGTAARNGMLFKSAEALEILHQIDTVVLDKTGTITEGRPKVTDIIPLRKYDKNELLRLAASLEKPSEHPLAAALVEAAENMDLVLQEVESYQALAGRGLRAVMNGKTWLAGNLSLMRENDIRIGESELILDEFSGQGKTPLLFACDGYLEGIIAVADVIKRGSAEAINDMRGLGLDVIMLTGDNRKTAEAISRQVSVNSVVSEVMPQDKDKVIVDLQKAGKKVAMVGDGINDAPALVRADVGLAVGAGTDIAIESADVVLMRSGLQDVVTAIRLSRKTIRNIRQNLFWAFFYNTAGIPLAAGVFISAFGWKLNPMFAAAAMSMSSICVVLNALRLRKFK